MRIRITLDEVIAWCRQAIAGEWFIGHVLASSLTGL
jgi:hypothetical protein